MITVMVVADVAVLAVVAKVGVLVLVEELHSQCLVPDRNTVSLAKTASSTNGRGSSSDNGATVL